MKRIFESRNLRAGFAAGVLAMLLAACGGGGDSGSEAPPPSPGASNAAPIISGQPSASVVVGQQYSFQPSASDVNNDTLTFSVSNLPAWATFSSSTGRISGTPSSSDLGAYSNIRVQVSDGVATAALPAFSITVTDVAAGTATVSWTPPTSNTDGSTLTNLAGYEIRYGRTANDLSQSVSLTNPSVNTYVIENLSSGAWYFAVAAINANGASSSLSDVASKTI